MIDWTPVPPHQVHVDAAALDRAVDLVRTRKARSQLCVLRHGRVVVDRTYGCDRDALFLIFSTSKPFVALLIHLLAERGQLSLDDPVAKFWPEFGQRGKEAITIRQVLQHRAGVPLARNLSTDAFAMANWRRSVRNLELARPQWTPGDVPAYHILSFGFILGEIVQRVTGKPLPDVLHQEFLDPLQLRDTHLGLPRNLWRRRVPVRGIGFQSRIRQRLFNLRSTRQAVIPAASVSTTARDLAVFYQALLRGGELDGVRILARETLEEATKPSSEWAVDRLLNRRIRWSQGFQLGGPSPDPDADRPMGQLSSPATFGHNGSNCCLAWADPSRGLVFSYVTDLLPTGDEGRRHLSQLSDALLSACEED